MAKKKTWSKNNLEKTRTYGKTYRKRHYEKETERVRTFLRKYHKTDKHKQYFENHKTTISYKWHLLNISAKQKRLKLRLAKEDNHRLCTSKCHYCGDYPTVHNGIDRVDSKRGYIIGNVVPCCTTCNMAKKNFDIRKFITGMCNVGAFQLKDESFTPIYNTSSPSSFKSYLDRARKKNLQFELTKRDFETLQNRNCEYCNTRPMNGIDRINNDKGYTHDNSVPCCTLCNYMKRDESKETFVEKAIKIYKRWAK